MQFRKVDCINKTLIQKLKEQLAKSYKLGECQIVKKDIDISQTIKHVESLSLSTIDYSNDDDLSKKDSMPFDQIKNETRFQKKTDVTRQIKRRNGNHSYL